MGKTAVGSGCPARYAGRSGHTPGLPAILSRPPEVSMHRLRGLVATGFLLLTGISAASCGSSDATRATAPEDARARAALTPARRRRQRRRLSTVDGGSTGGATAIGPDASVQLPPNLLHCGTGSKTRRNCDDGNKKLATAARTTAVLLQGGRRMHQRASATFRNVRRGSHLQEDPGSLPDGTICGQTSTCQAGLCKPAEANCGDTLVISRRRSATLRRQGLRDNVPLHLRLHGRHARLSRHGPCAAPESCDDTVHVCTATGAAAKDLTPCERSLCERSLHGPLLLER